MKTLVRLTAVLFAGALLTACSDSPSAPAAHPADAPSRAASAAPGQSEMTVPMLWMNVRVARQSDIAKVIAGMRVTFRNGIDSVQVWDNDANDLDARWGFLSTRMRLGSQYTARVSGGDPTWYRPEGWKAALLEPGVAEFGSIQLARSPIVIIKVVNALTGTPVAGTEFDVSKVGGGGYMWLTDNKQGFDTDQAVGTLSYPFEHLGALQFCENKIPTNFYALNPTCFTVDVPQTDKVYTKTVTYSPVLKALPRPS